MQAGEMAQEKAITCVEQISTDIAFIAKGTMCGSTCRCTGMIIYDCVLELQQRNGEYCAKQNAGKASDKTDGVGVGFEATG